MPLPQLQPLLLPALLLLLSCASPASQLATSSSPSSSSSASTSPTPDPRFLFSPPSARPSRSSSSSGPWRPFGFHFSIRYGSKLPSLDRNSSAAPDLPSSRGDGGPASAGISGHGHGEALVAAASSPSSKSTVLIAMAMKIVKSAKVATSKALSIAGQVVWLLLLFYLLGTTASDYFSYTLERLSDVLRLSPPVAGVTLLAIGNGAPDVFSSVASFASSGDTASIGFGSVLGGALFVTTVVSGSVALVTARASRLRKAAHAKIDSLCFVRDALFLLGSAIVLTLILLDSKVYLWEAIVFLCIYILYVGCVWGLEMLGRKQRQEVSELDLLLIRGSSSPIWPRHRRFFSDSLPQWSPLHHQHLSGSVSPQHHRYFSEGQVQPDAGHFLESLHGVESKYARLKHYAILVYRYGIEWPLAQPRRFTIPMVEEEPWSRPVTVASCFLSPVFLGGVCIFELENYSTSCLLIVGGVSAGLGIACGLLALFNTENERPPQRFLWLWLTSGFLMSIVWFYIIADLLVSSLEVVGSLLKISTAILGLTVLAWGNSIGDLVADVTLACGSKDGVQIAVSGCYAGPLFNTVVGLGLSLVLGSWRSSPEPLSVDNDDNSLFYIIAFLGGGLLWALVMVPVKGMMLSKSFGAGLIVLYCGFLVVGTCYTMGWISQ